LRRGWVGVRAFVGKRVLAAFLSAFHVWALRIVARVLVVVAILRLSLIYTTRSEDHGYTGATLTRLRRDTFCIFCRSRRGMDRCGRSSLPRVRAWVARLGRR